MTDRLHILCDRFRAVMRRLLLLLGFSRLVSIGLAAVVALVLTDFFWHFGHAERFAALAVLLGVVALVALRDLVQPLRLSWSDKEVLRYLDSAIPGSNDRLINIDELQQPNLIAEAASPQGRAVVQEAVEQLERSLEKVDLAGVWQRQSVQRWVRGVLFVVLASLGLGAIGQFATAERYTAIGLGRLLAPWADVYWPSSTRFALLSPAAGASVPEGEDLPVRVQLQGRIPPEVTLVYNPTDESGRFTDRAITVGMFVNPDGTAEYTFAKLSDSLRFHIAGGDGKSAPVEVNVVKRPYLREVQAYYKYPPYTGVPPRITNDPQLTGLEGTDVRLNFTASGPLRAAWVQLTGQPVQPLTLTDNGLRFEWFHQLRDSTSYTIGMEDEHGNREKRAEVHRIQVTPDQPPTARLLEPSGDLEVTARARFRVRFQADDDYGLKQVRLMVSKDGKPAEPLDEKITGPIPQIGKTSAGAFDWDLEKLDLAGVGTLRFFLAARDVNPTGRGQAESAHLQLTLKSELEVQSNVLLAAKALLTEALLGANNQRWAHLDAVKWLKTEGATEQDQALFKQFQEEQELAQRAAGALEGRFKALTVEMARNRMEGAFFARRLEQIGQLIRALAAERQPQIARALREARPANVAEDTPSGRVAKMKKALTALDASLKLAALEYQRLFYLLADWNDLQQVLVTSRRLHELQQKVHATSVKVAPQWIGKEIEDLSETDARLLATIAQQQETIRDSERALEEELQTLALAAQSQGRKQVFGPLKDNLELLRLRAVNDKLIQVARGIKDNRIDATLQDQLYVLKVFTFVAGKFEQAGQDVTTLAALDVKTPIADDREVKIVAKPTSMGETVEGLTFNPESKVDVEDIGAYKVNTIEQALVFLQAILDDQVILYTQYTEQRFTEKERSSRYRQLRLGMLGIRVQRALEASSKVQEFAKDHPFAPTMAYVQTLHVDLDSVGKLIAAGQTGPATQAIARDLSATAQTTRRFLAQHGRMLTQIEDREKSKGLDEFGQPYVTVGGNLATLVQLRNDLGWAAVLQQDVNQKTRRLSGGQVATQSGQVQGHAVAMQEKVIELVTTARSSVKERITDKELNARLNKELSILHPDAFARALAGLKEPKLNAGLPAVQAELLESLRNALAGLDTLADERIRPKETLAKEVIDTQKAISQVDLKKAPDEIAKEIAAARAKALHDFQFDVLADRIKQAPLAPEVRTYLLQTLASNPDPKYRTLISAYINPLVPPPAKEKEKP
ncbi:hypothetical protein AYO44_00955 [Planctomycetaceae bacterium SCGC AG-212-F19]|nr:hypothetical protein AYO44_00955 [Planctomycetaceae bacterium SCGC AG-212-F19]